MNISGLSGLYAHLNVPGGDVDNDAVLAADWTNNNAVTAAAIIP